MTTYTIPELKSKKFVYFTDGTVSGNNITYNNDWELCRVGIEKIEEDATNTNISVQIPVSRGNYSIKAPTNLIIDLKRWKTVFTITGYLYDEDGTGEWDSITQTKETKRDSLRYLAGLSSDYPRGGTVTMVWGRDGTDRQEYTGLITKFKIIDFSGMSGNLKRFQVIINFLVGENR